MRFLCKVPFYSKFPTFLVTTALQRLANCLVALHWDTTKIMRHTRCGDRGEASPPLWDQYLVAIPFVRSLIHPLPHPR